MKKVILSALLFLWGVLLSSQSRAGYDVEMTENGSEFIFAVDDTGRVQIQGLPLDGTYLYDSVTAVLYLTQSGTTWSLSVLPLENMVPEAEMISPDYAERSHVLGFNTRRWSLTSRNKYCHMVDGSIQMADKLHLDLTDIVRINIAIGYLTAQDMSQDACKFHRVSRALGHIVGFPAQAGDTPTGLPFRVERIVAVKDRTQWEIPEDAKRLTHTGYVDYLKGLLNQPALASFIRTAHRLDSDKLRVQALRTLLKDPRNRREFESKPLSASDLFDATEKAKSVVTTDFGR